MGQVEKSIIKSGLKYKPILVTKQKASEIFESLLCNPDGDIAIVAPNYEKKMLKAGIEKVKELEWSEKFHREASEFSDNEIYWKKNLLNKNLKEIFEKIECMEDLAWAKEQLQKVIELTYKDVLEAKGEVK